MGNTIKCFLEIELRNEYRNVPLTCQFRATLMYTASAPCLCGMKAVRSVFQERGGSFSNQMYPRSFRKVVKQLMGRKLIETSRMWFFWNERRHDPKPCLLKVERGEHVLYVSRKAHNLLLRQCEKRLSRHSVWARLALLQPGPKHCQISRGETSISWAPLSIARRHSRIRSFLAFSCNSRSAGTVISKMSA